MYKIKPELVRSGYIGEVLKEIVEQKGITISEIAEKMGTAQPSVSNALNGKKSVSDKFFRRVGVATGLPSHEINEIFKKADQEEYMYKHGESIDEYSEEEKKLLQRIPPSVKMAFSGNKLGENDLNEIVKFIEFREKQFGENKK